jgi:lipopolysaccharide/colanic/teichoic acid biosynthesis glycosyltransferase
MAVAAATSSNVTRVPLRESVAKRAFDLVVALPSLVLLSPVLLVIAAIVKLDSNGPVLYRGVRSGRYGRPFRIFKFRTMRPDAEQTGGGSTARDDIRVTRVGRVLRRYKLDELPQLINVIVGDMSLVGPRPELPQYTREYAGDEEVILSVRPGITDDASLEFSQLGDVLGNDDPDGVYELQVKPVKNALRVKYVRERSFTGDLRILGRTLRTIVKG